MKIYNTLTGKKEEFETIEPGKVKMYVCGPTVYDFIHVGNARPLVVFDAVRRYFLYKGYDVTYVQNYTDIDDRIIKRANKEDVSINVIADRYIAEAERDSIGLGAMTPTFCPRVTREMPEIIDMIQTLIEKGHAYAKNGSVFYNTDTFPEYGKLSKKNRDELNAGARIEVDEEKMNPADFVLWKPAKENEPGWPSPWGNGRPGWHIECSVMAKKYLGETIDIHAGGEDLIFPHHENEIAQSEAANEKMFSKYWMHVRHVNINNQKMAKSAGNFFTVREVSEKYPYEVIRFLILSSHYRSSVNFSEELMEAALNSYNRIKNCVFNLNHCLKENAAESMISEEVSNLCSALRFKEDFEAAMDDDFNTADAVTAVFEYVKFANRTVKEDSSKDYVSALLSGLRELCGILGIEIPSGDTDIDDVEIKALIEQRQAARKAKDFKTADEIRNRLLSFGIVLEDTRQGVRYMRVK